MIVGGDAGDAAARVQGKHVGFPRRPGKGLLGIDRRRGRIHGLPHETSQIMRPSGFRPRPGQAFAAERLHADHCPDHVAVDVDVAGANAFAHGFHGLVDARLDTVRQAVPGGIDRRDH